MQVGELGELYYNRIEPQEDVTTWVYEAGSFTALAKLQDGEQYSIVSDYLGTPIQAFNSEGSLIWERELDIYGRVRKERGPSNFVPMRYQGQYFDNEIGLCYNRFRYYDPEQGNYISQDPIGLAGNNPTLYGYVADTNSWVDVFGLSKYNPIEVLGRKVYQNSTDFVTGKPTFIDPSVHPSIKAKIEVGATNLD